MRGIHFEKLTLKMEGWLMSGPCTKKVEKLLDEYGLMYLLLAVEEIAYKKALAHSGHGEEEKAIAWRKIAAMALDFNADQLKLEVANHRI